MKDLNEAIKHCYDVAKETDCKECKAEHYQLAEWLEELRDLKSLEENDQLIKLPCKPGTKVWKIVTRCLYGDDCHVKATCAKCPDYEVSVDSETFYTHDIFDHRKEFGKSLFLRKDAAEEAAKKIREKVKETNKPIWTRFSL